MLFASREDDAFSLERMHNLEKDLLEARLPVQFVNRLSAKLEDLLLVARHRVVQTPLFLIVEGKKNELTRILGVPTSDEARRYFDS